MLPSSNDWVFFYKAGWLKTNVAVGIKAGSNQTNFSNSLIIHKENAKEINVSWVFGNQIKKTAHFLHPWFLLLKSFCLIKNIKHSMQFHHQMKEPRSSSKIPRCPSYFQLSSRCFIWCWHTASNAWNNTLTNLITSEWTHNSTVWLKLLLQIL